MSYSLSDSLYSAISAPINFPLSLDSTPPLSNRSSDSAPSDRPGHSRNSPSIGILPSELFSKLNSAIENRPDKEHLMKQNIISTTSVDNVDPSLHSVIRQLSQQKTENKLMSELGKRPSARQLVDRGILHDSHKGATVQNTQRAILRQMERDKLSEFIANRPTIEEIITKHTNLIEDTMTWTRQVSSGPIPLPRNCHTLTSIPTIEDISTSGNPGEFANAKLYLIGGYGTGQQLTELLEFDTESSVWTRPVVAGVIPAERYSHTCSAVGSQLILFGGFSFNGNWLDDVHILDTDFVQPFYPKLSKPQQPAPLNMLMWYQPQFRGVPPSPRAAHSATVIGGLIYIFAGNDGKTLFNDLFVLDTATMTWKQPQQFGQIPPPRAGHTANAIGKNRILIFGGGNANGPVNDLFILNVETMAWTRPIIKGTPPSPRAGHTACTVFGNQMLVFGGGYLNKVFNDLHLFNFETLVWSRPADTGTLPIPRAGHTSTVVGSRIFTFAGGDADDVFNDLHVLDIVFLRREMLPNINSLSAIHINNQQSRGGKRIAGAKENGSASGANSIRARSKSLSDIAVAAMEDDLNQSMNGDTEQFLFQRVQTLASEFHTTLSNSVKRIDSAAVEQKSAIEALMAVVRSLEENRIQHVQALKEEIRAAQQNFSRQVSDLRDLFAWQKITRNNDMNSLFNQSANQPSQPNSIRASAQFQQILALTNENISNQATPAPKRQQQKQDRKNSTPPHQNGTTSPILNAVNKSPSANGIEIPTAAANANAAANQLPSMTRPPSNSLVKEAVSKLNQSEQKQVQTHTHTNGKETKEKKKKEKH